MYYDNRSDVLLIEAKNGRSHITLTLKVMRMEKDPGAKMIEAAGEGKLKIDLANMKKQNK